MITNIKYFNIQLFLSFSRTEKVTLIIQVRPLALLVTRQLVRALERLEVVQLQSTKFTISRDRSDLQINIKYFVRILANLHLNQAF